MGKTAVCILTKDNEASIGKTLESISLFPEVILLDTGSKDNTLAIAHTFPQVKVYTSPFIGFGLLRNLAAEKASFDQILALDADEVLSPLLQDEILSLSPPSHTAYEISFHNYYRGKKIRGCGWSPETHVRLYNRQETSFSPSFVHEGLKTSHLEIKKLKHPIYHTPYRTAADFLRKMDLYSTLFAEERKGKVKSSFSKALLHAFFAFFKSYLLKRGFIDGREGFEISFYNGATAFYKYLKLAEKR